MAEPFLAEIKIVGFNFAPRGWAQCDGQILPINQNQSLYSLLGTTYGGNGRTDFALPDLRGRAPAHVGDAGGENITWGEKLGSENHTLSVAEIPSHNHGRWSATAAVGNNTDPTGKRLARPNPLTKRPYQTNTTANLVNMAPTANAGGGQAHNNMAPFQVLNFCIALQGLFPSRN